MEVVIFGSNQEREIVKVDVKLKVESDLKMLGKWVDKFEVLNLDQIIFKLVAGFLWSKARLHPECTKHCF